jgi:hypothetical protein
VLADRTLILMPICAWYTPCKRDATKQFLVQAEECLCNSLHTFYRTIVSRLSRLLLSIQSLSSAAAAAFLFLPMAEARGLQERNYDESEITQ